MNLRLASSVGIALALSVTPAGAQPSRTALTPGTTIITNVTVIPMTGDQTIRRAVVVVRDGRIAEIVRGPRRPGPTDAVVDGRGGYLLPGFADMHTHLFSDQYVPDSVGRAEMGILLANGITAARLMIGTPAQLALRRDIEAGRALGPNLWSASPHLTGRPDTNARVVTTPEEGRAAVREVGAAGYDFIKITSFIAPDVYEAIMAEANARGYRVDGHVNTGVTLARAAALGQNLQHLDGWFEALLPDSVSPRVSLTQYGVFDGKLWPTLDGLDWSKLAPLAGIVARSNVWVTPTLHLFNTVFASGETDSTIRARPDFKLIPADQRDFLWRARKQYWQGPASAVRTPARRERYVELRNRVAKALADSGAKMLVGSDAPDWFMSEGYTFHRELEALVEAGLTPSRVLRMATRNAAEFLGAAAEWGTIEIGKRADLVLLEANPLADIRASTRVRGTMIGGRWLPRAELDRLTSVAIHQINP